MLLYWLTSSHVTAKATVLFAVSASVGMLVMSMQKLGIGRFTQSQVRTGQLPSCGPKPPGDGESSEPGVYCH